MPPNRHSPQDTFDINMFDSRILYTSDGLDSALRSIEEACHQGEPLIGGTVAALDSRPHLLEYMISVLGKGAYKKLSRWILTGFPTSRTPTVMENMSLRLVQKFSNSLLSAEHSLTAGSSHNLRELHNYVELRFKVLKVLGDNTSPTPVGRNKGKAIPVIRRIDPLPLMALKIKVPTTDAEVRRVYGVILPQLRNILEEYLLFLRDPSSSDIFKSLYIEANPSLEGGSGQPQNPGFPIIQSMKDAICFDSIEEFGEWPILLSTRAQNGLRGVNCANDMVFHAAIKHLKELSQGHFSCDNQRPLTDPQTALPIYEAKVTGDTRLIYQIDCIPDPRYSHTTNYQHECQVIRIFGVFNQTQFNHGEYWDNLSQQLQQRGLDYVERCIFRNKPTDDGVISPAFFPPLPYHVQSIPQTTPLVKIREGNMKNIHSMLVLDKFFVLSQTLLNSILADKEVSHVFSVSAREQEVIEHPSSCYVIGRSGTGKTTTMLFKIVAIQRTWEQNPVMTKKPRQVFITQSQVLATKTKDYFERLMSAHSFEEFCAREGAEEDVELVDQDDNEQRKSKLRERKFSELADEDFPLFITYDRLCEMLQNDVRQGGRNDNFVIPRAHELGDEATPPTSPTSPRKSRLRTGSGIASSSDYMQQSRRKFVSYGVFWAHYWDHLPQTLTRGLDPALVFGEFMGVIKGSEDAIGTKDRCLDQESYKSLSIRSQGTFSHKRDDIYDLFTAYTKLKRLRQEYDAADRTHYILKDLRSVGLVGQKVDFLYVDEVQDNLLIDTLVLRTICANQHGLFWGGDTAQAISVGSSFQFAELKAYQYRIEKQLSHQLGITPVEPKTFELLLNYRSHGGIVNCARSIIELIIHYWPHSIDVLQPERAITDGFLPIFFTDQEEDDLENSFLRGHSGETTNFGAHQCIIVRNDTTKERLEKMFQGSFVMTLYETKGLEFDDVILYNFFEDSMATLNQWRLVLNEVPVDLSDPPDAPTFEKTRHASICAELKFLYVAITRARNNLWIVDGSDTAEPMKVYWSRKGQIEIRSSAAEVQSFAVKSDSAEEWLRMGKKMFFSKHYAQASVAFIRAGREREAAICNAHHLQEKARSTSTAASVARIQAFVAAANAFIACAQDSPSEHVDERLSCYGNAGECYLEANDFENAGCHYLTAQQYAEAACAYRDGRHFDKMKDVVTDHRDALGSGFLARSTLPARFYYFERLNIGAALTFFDSEEDALVFLEDCNLDEARVKLLVQLDRIPEAAEVYAKNWDMLKAVELITTHDNHGVDYVRRTIEYLLTGLRRGLTLGVLPTSSPTVPKLLSFTGRLNKGVMTKRELDELAMFEAIQRADRTSLRTLAETFIRIGNDPAALLCLDHVFAPPFQLRKSPLFEVQTLLFLYLDYLRLLNKFRRGELLAEGSNCQRLFGFRVQGGNSYLVPEHTLLHRTLTGKSGPSKRGTGGHECSYSELSMAISQLVSSRIHDRTEIQNSACYDIYGFSLCLRSLVQTKCRKESCPLQHIELKQLTTDWYHTRVCLILLQFKILDSAYYCERDVKDYWLRVLYSALHPPLPMLGSLANLDFSKIPEGADGLRIAREWIQDVCNDNNCDPSDPVDRQHFMVACTLAFDLDRKNAQDFVPSTPMYASTRKLEKTYISLDSRHVIPRRRMNEEVNSVMQDFIAFLTAERDYLLASGASCLHELLRSRLRVDMNVLCDLVERLSGLFITSHKINSHGGVLHDVTLPRSWIINLKLLDAGRDLRMNTSIFSTLASNMIELMQRIDVQVRRYIEKASDPEEQFVADHGGLLTDFTGSLCLTRICFCLCLMGHNTDDTDLKDKVLVGIQSLRRGDEQFTPWIYRRYANANGWDDLVDVFTESLRNSSFDEIVHLVHTTIPGPDGWRSKYVHPVSYNKLDKVSELFHLVVPNTFKPVPTPPRLKKPPVKVKSGEQPDGDREERQQQKNTQMPRGMSMLINKSGSVVPREGHEKVTSEPLVNATKSVTQTQ